MNLLLINYSQSFHSAVLNSLKNYKAKIIVSEGIDNTLIEIQKYNINIAVINWSTGDFDIKELCKKIRKFKHTKYIYILLVISRDREESYQRNTSMQERTISCSSPSASMSSYRG